MNLLLYRCQSIVGPPGRLDPLSNSSRIFGPQGPLILSFDWTPSWRNGLPYMPCVRIHSTYIYSSICHKTEEATLGWNLASIVLWLCSALTEGIYDSLGSRRNLYELILLTRYHKYTICHHVLTARYDGDKVLFSNHIATI